MQDRECDHRSNNKAYAKLEHGIRISCALLRRLTIVVFKLMRFHFRKGRITPTILLTFHKPRDKDLWFLYLFIKRVLSWRYPWDVANPI